MAPSPEGRTSPYNQVGPPRGTDINRIPLLTLRGKHSYIRPRQDSNRRPYLRAEYADVRFNDTSLHKLGISRHSERDGHGELIGGRAVGSQGGIAEDIVRRASADHTGRRSITGNYIQDPSVGVCDSIVEINCRPERELIDVISGRTEGQKNRDSHTYRPSSEVAYETLQAYEMGDLSLWMCEQRQIECSRCHGMSRQHVDRGWVDTSGLRLGSSYSYAEIKLEFYGVDDEEHRDPSLTSESWYSADVQRCEGKEIMKG
ncbi:hypothetical protein Tco_0436116 [Tanacetum coccineum]